MDYTFFNILDNKARKYIDLAQLKPTLTADEISKICY